MVQFNKFNREENKEQSFIADFFIYWSSLPV